MPLNANSLSTTVAALVLVLGLMLLAARVARATGLARGRSAAGSTGLRLSLQDSLAIDRGRRIHLVRCDDQDLVLLTGGGTDVVLGWLPRREAAGSIQP